MLSTRGHALPKECIAETLWPDSPTAIANLHAAARDVRRWMGIAEGLVYERELYALTVRDIDADRFETEISSARTLRRTDPSQAGRRYQAALAIYEGPFLPEETGLDCVISRRVQLEVWFAEAAMFVGTAALENGEPEAALDFGTRVSDLDETREDAARLQMRALASLGRRAEALRRFERLRLILGRRRNAASSAAIPIQRPRRFSRRSPAPSVGSLPCCDSRPSRPKLRDQLRTPPVDDARWHRLDSIDKGLWVGRSRRPQARVAAR